MQMLPNCALIPNGAEAKDKITQKMLHQQEDCQYKKLVKTDNISCDSLAYFCMINIKD